ARRGLDPGHVGEQLAAREGRERLGPAVDGDLAGADEEQRVAEAAFGDDRLARVVALDVAGLRDPRELVGREVDQQRMGLEQGRVRHDPSIVRAMRIALFAALVLAASPASAQVSVRYAEEP